MIGFGQNCCRAIFLGVYEIDWTNGTESIQMSIYHIEILMQGEIVKN